MVNYFYKLDHTWQFLKICVRRYQCISSTFEYPTEKTNKTRVFFSSITFIILGHYWILMARVWLTFFSLHNILHYSQFLVTIKYCQYSKLFLTQLYPFLSPSEQVAIFSHKPCRVGSPRSILSAWLVLCRGVDNRFGETRLTGTMQLALRTDFTHSGFSF